MAPEGPAVLLVGGGEGMGQLEATVDAIATQVGAACQARLLTRVRTLASAVRSLSCRNGGGEGTGQLDVAVDDII
jgi:hypothetical protein